MLGPAATNDARLPSISVVVPTLNQNEFIRTTLDSLLSQQYPNLEVIVVDGGSSDGTHETLAGYGDRISWSSGPDTGQSNAINKGFAQATGEILCFLNSDDILLPGSLHTVGAFFAAHPAVQWLTGDCGNIDIHGRDVRPFIDAYKAMWRRFARTRSTLLLLNYVAQVSTFWRRSAMDSVGPLNESLHWSMDYDYWLRLSRFGPPAYIPTYLSSFRTHGGSKSAIHRRTQFRESAALAKRYGGPLAGTFHDLHLNVALLIYAVIDRKELGPQR